MKLQELVNKLIEKRAEANIEPNACDPRIRAGAEGLVRAAKKEYDALSRQYQDEIMKSIVVIAASGPNAQQFAAISTREFNTLAIDYKLAVRKIVSAIERRGGRPTYNNQEHHIALSELQQMKLDYGILQIKAPLINHYTDCVYDQPLDIALDNMFQKNYGVSLYSALTRREIGRLALEAEFAGKLLPVVLYNYSGEVDASLLPQPVVHLEINEDVNKTFVKKVLLDVKNQINTINSTDNHNE